jgi:chain length determinant protein tyrosine kinase EpsG
MNAPQHRDIRLPRLDRSIGAILVDAGRLSAEDAERVLKLQREREMRFGDAALSLGLVSQADIDFALARQFEYPYLVRGESPVDEELVAAYTPFSRVVERLRHTRSQLMLRWFGADTEQKTLAVVSPESGDGRSWLAANLAVVFSQLGERTLLIDADLRKPRQHTLFGIDNKQGLSAVLSGRGGPDAIKRISSLLDLSVLPSGALPPNPQELLARPIFSRLLAECASAFDVVLIDTPAAGEYADAHTISVRASGALLLAQRNRSRASKLRSVSEELMQAGATIVGAVLNER